MIKHIILLIERVDTCIVVLRRMCLLMEELSHKQERPQAIIQPVDAHQPKRISVMDVPPDDALFTIQEACERMKISRGTLTNLRNRNLFTEVEHGGRAPRFLASEVEQLRKWYSVQKGKI